MSIQRLVCDAVHTSYPKYFANFPPNEPIKLGDFGYLKNYCFDRQGNIKEVYGLEGRTPREGSHADVEFKSRSDVSVKTSAAGTLNATGTVNADAEAVVEFKKANSVFFIATGCQIKAIENKVALGKEIIQLFIDDSWDGDYVVVTSIIEATTLNLFVSHNENASIKLKATADVPNFNVFDAGINGRIVDEVGIANKWVAEQHTIPLLGLSKISRKLLLGELQFKTAYLVGEDAQDLDELKNQIMDSGEAIEDKVDFLDIDDSENLSVL